MEQSFAARLHHILVCASYREGEPAEERKRKQIVIPFIAFALVSILIWGAQNAGDERNVRFVVWCCNTTLTVTLLAFPFITRSMSTRFLDVFAIYGGLAVFTVDLLGYGVYQQWLWVVVLMDMVLVVGGTEVAYPFLRVATAAYITFHNLDSSFSLGVYSSIPPSSDSEPPDDVPVRVGMARLFTGVAVVLIDASIMKHFACSVVRERKRVATYLEVLRTVSNALVRFDLAKADEVLCNHGDTGEEDLLATLGRLVENLRLYRPYLPDAL
eukprot:Sspe_Gene.102141::Locus_76955_Transcript_1_1_Confidence_1.000_Length_859::g.102141::m.102141